jgi:alpha-L-fucosidase 2
VRGLCARGGFVVDIYWRDGKLTFATIHSRHGGSTPVRYAGHITTLHLGAGESLRLRPDSFRQPAVDNHESEA